MKMTVIQISERDKLDDLLEAMSAIIAFARKGYPRQRFVSSTTCEAAMSHDPRPFRRDDRVKVTQQAWKGYRATVLDTPDASGGVPIKWEHNGGYHVISVLYLEHADD